MRTTQITAVDNGGGLHNRMPPVIITCRLSWIPIRLASVFEPLIRRDPRYACKDVCVMCRSEIQKEADPCGYNEVRLITANTRHHLSHVDVIMLKVVLCMAWPEAVSQAKPGQNRPGQARPK